MENLKKRFVLMTLVFLALHLMVLKASIALADGAGAVVINEVAWAGTSDGSNDEWIELYNVSSGPVDLAGWTIEDDDSTVYEILEGEIGAHGYFLIEDSEDATNVVADGVIGLSLANAGDKLVLKDADGVIVDTVNSDGGAWFAGDSVSKASMERIDPLEGGDVADNWADAVNSNGSEGRSGSSILGTPGSVNGNYGGSGPLVSLAPSSMVADNGGLVTFAIEVENAVDLYAFGVEVLYDPSVLDFVDASEGDLLGSDMAGTIFNAALEDGVEGKLIVGGARLKNPASGIDGSGMLFDISFDVVGANGVSADLIFGGASYVSDSISDVPASFGAASIVIGGEAIGSVTGLAGDEGSERYSVELSWGAVAGADSYVVKKKMPDGTFMTVGQSETPGFVDTEIVPGINYDYQVITVKGAGQSLAEVISAGDSRGVVGDLDRSDRVDGRDIELLARSYGSEYGDEEYSPLYDMNYDGVIDGSDLIDLGVNFGMTY